MFVGFYAKIALLLLFIFRMYATDTGMLRYLWFTNLFGVVIKKTLVHWHFFHTMRHIDLSIMLSIYLLYIARSTVLIRINISFYGEIALLAYELR